MPNNPRNKGIRVKSRTRRKWRTLLLTDQQNKCCICGRDMTIEDATFEHAVPVTRGGRDALCNLLVAHRECNQKKGNKIFPYMVVTPYFGCGRVSL